MKVIKLKDNVPLLGALFIGVVDRGTNLLQVRATTVCNLKCLFCSTAANDSEVHPVDFEVSVEHLVKWVKEVVRVKGNIDVLADSVGNPICYPRFVELVRELRKIKEIGEISTQANGMVLNKNLISKLEKTGLDRINLSLMSLDDEKAKRLSGVPGYDLERVLKIIEEVRKSKIDLLITPVYIPGVNDIEEIVKFCKEKEIDLGIQNYEIHKYGRKIKGVKKLGWWKFYELLKKLEKKYDIKLKIGPKDFGIEKRKKLDLVFKKNERISVEIISEGWLKGQMLGVAKDRLVSVNKCDKKTGDRVNVKIISNKNGIYVGEMTRV